MFFQARNQQLVGDVGFCLAQQLPPSNLGDVSNPDNLMGVSS